MKKIRLLILTIIFMLPMIISAGTYEVEVNKANSLLNKENYVHTYEKYIVHGTNIKFEYSENTNKVNTSFTKGGFISLEEYNLTKKKDVSYLFEGIEFWTLSKNGSNVYAITYGDTNQAKNPGLSYSGRATEFVNPNVTVHGSGKLNNPWVFDSIFKVTAKVDNRFATITSGNNAYVRGGCTASDCTANIVITPKEGYRYIANDCNGLYNEASHTLSINNVKRDTTCNVSFGKGLFVVTLNSGTPNKIYLKYGENYYKDFAATTIIRKIDAVSPKTGYTFIGYFYNNNKVINGDKETNREDNKKILYESVTGKYISSDVTLEPSWEANQYKIIYNCGAGQKPPTTQIATYDSQFTITSNVCQREGYIQTGWNTKEDMTGELWTTGNKTNVKWTIAHDVTLYAKWEPCPKGTYSPLSSNTCITCPAGSFCDNEPDPDPDVLCPRPPCPSRHRPTLSTCPDGYTSDAGAQGEQDCYKTIAKGYYLKEAKGTATEVCGNGYYSDEHRVYYGSSDSCTQCPAGYRDGTAFSNKTSESACLKKVPDGYYVKKAKDKDATACAAGTIRTHHQLTYGEVSSCTTCLAGTYVLTTGSNACTTCEEGYYCTGGTNHTKCDKGQEGTGAGKKNKSEGCAACVAGKYSDEEGLKDCKLCIKGSISTAGQTACTACQPSGAEGENGTTSGNGKATCDTSCNKAHVNTWDTAVWNTNNTLNKNCIIKTCVTGYSLASNTCSAKTYTVTYDKNGGTGTMANSTATYDANFVTRQNAFTRTGYTFNGWNEKADGSGTAWPLNGNGTYENGNGSHPWKWTYDKNITLYAQWTAKTYTVTYDKNGGTGTMSNSTATYDANFVTRQNTFTRTGYVFNGWNEKADGSGTPWPLNGNGTYENGNGTKPWKWKYDKNITLYAQWINKCSSVGAWSCGNYGSYGTCSNVCGGGTKSRTRTCTKYSTYDSSYVCDTKTETDTASCGGTSSSWSCGNYGSYGSCSNVCGGGTKSRTRTCNKLSTEDNSTVCDTKTETDTASCGGTSSSWSCGNYGSYGSCSNVCGGGTKSRTRTCNKLSTEDNSTVCDTKTETDTASCGGTSSTWTCGNYGSYGNCSNVCGGTKSRTRTCNKLSTEDNSTVCDTKTETDSASCGGTSSTWSCGSYSYGACSKLCGTGTQTVSRTCYKYSTLNTSTVCDSKTESFSQECNKFGCCVETTDEFWYTQCGACSKTCGGGTKHCVDHYRNMSTITGDQCSQYATNSRNISCNTQSCGGGCFLKGTKVKTNLGYKDIDKISKGDLVLTYNETTGKNEYKKVLEKLIHIDTKERLYTLDIEGKELKVTEAHRFYIRKDNSYDWISARDLKVGDYVRYANGTFHRINNINYVLETNIVYNLTIKDNHNYYVGYDEILVHNAKVNDPIIDNRFN